MTTRTVTATYKDPTGNPLSGRVSFQLAVIASDGTATIYGAAPIVVTLNSTGQLSIALVTTDSLTVANLAYQVTEVLAGQRANRFYMTLAAGGSPIDLATVTRLTNVVLYDYATNSGVAAAIATDDAKTTNIHGIADTSALITNAAQLPWIGGILWAFIGDSITLGSGVSTTTKSFATLALRTVGGLVARPDSYVSGIGGQTSAQILARLPALLAYKPGGLIIECGVNDAATGVTLSSYAANLTAMISAAKAANCGIVVCTVPPRPSSVAAAIHASIASYNAWIKQFVPAMGGYVADVFTDLTDASGYLSTNYDSGDGIHPNGLGHGRFAARVGAAMIQASRRKAPYGMLASQIPVGNPWTDPLNARATVVGGDWYEVAGGTGTAPTYSMVSDTFGILPGGRWAQMDFDGSASGGVRQLAIQAASGKVSTGDSLLGVAHIQIEDMSGTWQADVAAGTAGIVMSMQTQWLAAFVNGLLYVSGIPNAANPAVYDIGPVIIPGVLNVGTLPILNLALTVPTGKHYKMRIGCVGGLNATVLGMTTQYSWSYTPTVV